MTKDRSQTRLDKATLRRWVVLLLCVILGVGLLSPHGVDADDEDDRLNVELVGTLSTIWPRSEPFVVAEDVAFIQAIDPATESIMGIAVVDLSKPNAPNHTATIADKFLENLYTDGTYLFGETKTGTTIYETHVYSIKGISQPQFVGSSIPGQVVYSDSQYAVLLKQGNLKTIDLSDPKDGVFPEVGGYTGADALLNVTTNGGILAYAGINNGIKIISLGTPTGPREVGVLRFPEYQGAVSQIVVSGSYVYVKAAGGVVIVDVSDPGSPTVAAYGPVPGFTGNLQVVDGLLYTANSDGLHVYSLADPVAPVEIGYYREMEGGQWLQIHAEGATVYAIVRFDAFSGRAEFRVLRFTNAPKLVIQANGPGIAINGDPLAVGASQVVTEGDQIETTDAESELDMVLFCEDLGGFVQLLAMARDWDDDSSYLVFGIFAIAYEHYCITPFLPQGQITVDRLELELQSGGTRFNVTSPGLDLTVHTPAVSIHSLGTNQFAAIQASQGQTTTIVSRLGAISVTPKNTKLPPITLHSGQKVDVSLTASGPVTEDPTWFSYLPLLLGSLN